MSIIGTKCKSCPQGVLLSGNVDLPSF
jgi:hypothetical protein